MEGTQEKKEDFLYRPRRRLASAEKKVETEDNADIRLIDPRLASEFEFRVGHRRIGMFSPSTSLSDISWRARPMVHATSASVNSHPSRGAMVPPLPDS